VSAPSLRCSVLSNKRLLAGAAALLGLGEFADAFAISFWEGAAGASALFLAAALWTRRGGVGGPILVAALCVFELQSFPTWKRTGLEDWISQTAFAVGSAITLVVAIAVLRAALVARKTVTPTLEPGGSL
jgi:hypothetical protein